MASCQKCSAPMMWKKTPAGKSNPLDPDPTPRGNVVLVEPDACRTLAGDELARAREEGVSLYLSHFVTCKFAAAFRKKPAPRV